MTKNMLDAALGATLPACKLLLCLFISSLCFAQNTTATRHGVILLYHHVAEDTPAITSISPADFEAQLQFLEDHDFQIWPLPKLVAALNAPDNGTAGSTPNKIVAITFDDNYESVYREAYPRLKKRGWPFTIFVSSDAIDQGINMQASWAQLREMAAHGATVANHSATHAHLLHRLSNESHSDWRTRIEADIAKAQRRIHEETGQQHPLFAYPYGEFNQELAQLVTDLGYIGIGQHSGAAGSDSIGLAIPRYPFAGNYSDVADFALKVFTLPLPVKEIEAKDNPLAFDEPPPSLTLALQPGAFNPQLLQCYGSGQGALNLQWLSQWQVKVIPKQAFPLGRSRFNCTLPAGKSDEGMQRYFWYSKPWIRLTKDGRLLD